MVHFKKLRLSGFKSFVDPAELVIEPGMTGVVGPNGCGKSNLVEALRWVMGETSAKRMRGENMDDVIFGGTAHRPPRSFAEVLVVLDNHLRTAPSLFNAVDEIEISRRIVRGEGSVYRFNGKELRAKDVQLLFADMVTGARSTAMVSQGQVGMLINARPSHRRSLLEEAAGIAGLHTRRQEAELRLRAAEANLQRLEDVLGTLNTQLSGLRRQARQAQRYRTVSETLRMTEAMLLTMRWTAAATALSQAQTLYHQSQNDTTERAKEAASAAQEQMLAAQELPDLRQAEAGASASLHRLLIAREQLDAEEKRIAHARAQAEGRLRQIANDIERESIQSAEAETTLARLEEERLALETDCRTETVTLELAQKQVKDLTVRAETQDMEATALTEKAAAFETTRTEAARRVEETTLRVKRLENRLQEAEAAVTAARSEGGDDNTITAAEDRASEIEARLEILQSDLEAAQHEVRNSAADIDTARDTVQEEASARARLQAEIQTLETVLGSSPDEEGPPVLDRVQVAAGYEQALGVALGEMLSVPLAEDAPSATLRWQTLPPSSAGRPLPSGVFPLHKAVKAPEALYRALSVVGVVETEDQAETLHHDLAPGQILVTKEGAVWRWDGLTGTSDAPSSTAQLLRERNRLDTLRLDLTERETRVSKAETRLETARRRFETATERVEAARITTRGMKGQLAAAQSACNDLIRKKDAAETRLAAARRQVDTIALDLTEARVSATEAKTTQEALSSTGDLRAKAEEHRTTLAETRVLLVEARLRFEQVTRDAENRQRRLQTLEKENTQWQRRKREATTHHSALTERHRAALEDIESLAEHPLLIAAERERLDNRLEESEARRKLAADRLADAERRAISADTALREAEKAASRARERLARAEAMLEQEKRLLEQAAEQIHERLHCTPAQAHNLIGAREEETPLSLEEVEARLQHLIKERESIGPVNLRAEQEVTELETQTDSITSERNDLIAAIARFRQGIGELNREGRHRLLASFEKVDTHFRRLFTHLFGGGQAHLALTESEDPLEAGLEIFASPPGKRLQVLSLMSGGEQAMTALALLFAVFLVNPAPICVLDEVDAPLDDANVDRFCSMLDRLTRMTGEVGGTATRFLVVTHHRMTMARMDRLFGVTMQERGVSQLVSVDLQRAETWSGETPAIS